jgi:phage tail protein X
VTQTYIASNGDTAELIAWKVYGTQDARVVEQLLDANPGLADLGPELIAGTSVMLPTISTTAQLQGRRLWD